MTSKMKIISLAGAKLFLNWDRLETVIAREVPLDQEKKKLSK